MRLLPLFLLLALSGLASAQQRVSDEDAYLRELALAARAKSVAESKLGIPASAEPLKVCVVAPEQDKVAADFAAWLDRWNASEGGSYGRVEIVAAASQADIILARFVSPDFKAKPTVDDPSWNGSMRDPATHRVIPTARAHKPAPFYTHAYSFVAARDAGGLKLLWRAKDSVSVEGGEWRKYADLKGSKDSKRAGDRLRDKFFEMMRARAR